VYSAAHVSISTKNIKESYTFYNSILGFEAIERIETDELKIININAGEQAIELLERKNKDNSRPQTGPIDHIAFYVDNFDEEYERLKSLGVKMLLEAPKYFKDKKLMFFEGPNGERIEIMEI
jgi:lactoylglutathione lyase